MQQLQAYITTRLDQLIRARYPLIAILSNEERRVQRTVRQIAEQQKKAIIAWTVTNGFKALDERPSPLSGVSAGDPIGALQTIGSYDTPRTIFVVKDLHPFLQDPVVTRALRDLAESLTETTKTVILVSPRLTVPADLEKDVAVVDFPLPEPAERKTLLTAFANDLPPGVPVHLNGDTAPLVEALSGLTETEIMNVLASAAIATGELAKSAIPEILRLKAQIIKQSGLPVRNQLILSLVIL